MSATEQSAIQLAASIVERYQVTALFPLIDSCRTFARNDSINVAVLGRFKAGKSSFLNHLLGVNLLPVGAIPVTSVITEIGYGPTEQVRIQHVDGSSMTIGLEDIRDYVDEARNPENHKRVTLVQIELPSLAGLRGVRFIDTPGLESVLAHNTETSQAWLPNVGLALVAVAIDPPLSQSDIELIRDLQRYTPHVSVLLTKVDLLDDPERTEVQEYVASQLNRRLHIPIPVFPYSVRPGYEHLRQDLQHVLLTPAVAEAGIHRESILARKTETLLRECSDYLMVALRAAETIDSDRRTLKDRIVGEKQSFDETTLAVRLIVRNASANTRARNENILKEDEPKVRDTLLEAFNQRFPQWTASLKTAAIQFEEWLQPAMAAEMWRVSSQRQSGFIEPAQKVERQLTQVLQDFRNRISERSMAVLDVPLRTSELDLRIRQPQSPDIRIGKIFDRNWELLSFAIPMSLIKGLLKGHFVRKIEDAAFKNLSRLAFQWEESVNPALAELEREATRRVAELIATIEHLLRSGPNLTEPIRQDLDRLHHAIRLLN